MVNVGRVPMSLYIGIHSDGSHDDVGRKHQGLYWTLTEDYLIGERRVLLSLWEFTPMLHMMIMLAGRTRDSISLNPMTDDPKRMMTSLVNVESFYPLSEFTLMVRSSDECWQEAPGILLNPN